MPTPPPLMKPDISPRQCGGTDSVPNAWVLWAHRWRLTKASGDIIVIRYADDTIVGFQPRRHVDAVGDVGNGI
jgi:hypothetical protein